jgi:hypothetical protein
VEKMHQYTQQKIQCNKQYVQPVTVPGTESVIYISGETNKKHYPFKMRSVWILKSHKFFYVELIQGVP